MSEVEQLTGAPGSPYTRKMLSLMRYRRIPYQMIPTGKREMQPEPERHRPRPEPKVGLLPTFYFQSEQGEEFPITDSSPIIRRFEEKYPLRKVIPDNPAMAFINMLIEDYADEWLTKPMFHYRWSYAADIKKAGQMLPRWHNTCSSDADIEPASKYISERQISRLSYVGSNEVTKETIENSFHRFLSILDKQLLNNKFILGKRPSSCDFAIYGQLTCLALFDPTPQAIILDEAPRVYAWTETMEDISGYEILDDDWYTPENYPESLTAFLNEIGRIYAPYLLANAKAVMNGDKLMETTLDGRPWQQNPFTYQAKCLQWLREAYFELDADNKAAVDQMIAGTGIETILV